MKFNDAVFGALLLALGLAVLVGVQGFPKIPGQQVGPALFPGLIAVGLSVGGLILLVRGWRARAQQPWLVLRSWVRSPRHLGAFVLLIASVVFYLLASQWLGFVLCSTLILSLLLLVLGVPPPRALPIALVATLLIHLAFYKLLRVPLPWGLLADYAW